MDEKIDNKIKKVGILVSELKKSGLAKVAANLSILFTELGYDVSIISNNSESDFEYAGKLISLNIKSEEKGIKKTIGLVRKYLILSKIKRERKFDIVISNGLQSHFLNYLTKKNEKILYLIHNNLSENYGNKAKIIGNLIFKNADYIVTVSKEIKEILHKKFNLDKNKIQTIYNFIDIQEINQLKNFDIGELKNKDYLLNVGRLSNQKGQWSLIKIFWLLSHDFKELELVLLGSGELERKLKDLTKKIGIEDKVRFIEFNENPYKYMTNCKIYCSTSRYEGFPMVYLEAMACGSALISTNCISGPKEILESKDEKFGILVDNILNLDYESLSIEEINYYFKLKELLSKDKLIDKYKLKSLKRAERFDKHIIKKEWKELLEKI